MCARATLENWLIIQKIGGYSKHLPSVWANTRQDPRELRIYPPSSPNWSFSANIDTVVQPSSLRTSKLGPRCSDAFCNARTINRRIPSHLIACPHIYLPRPRPPCSFFPREMETTALGLQRVEDAEGNTPEPVA